MLESQSSNSISSEVGILNKSKKAHLVCEVTFYIWKLVSWGMLAKHGEGETSIYFDAMTVFYELWARRRFLWSIHYFPSIGSLVKHEAFRLQGKMCIILWNFTAILRHTRTVANFSVATSWFLVDVNQNRCHNNTRFSFSRKNGLFCFKR